MTTIPMLDKPIKRLMELDQCSVFALADIAEERLRQIEKEGWTTEHDDAHPSGQMARAAACYALGRSTFKGIDSDSMWPWDLRWWKPSSPHRNRVRAGALLVAELARHLRSAPANAD